MSRPQIKLVQFSAVFVTAAIVIFFYMKNSNPSEMPAPMVVDIEDSRASQIQEELTSLKSSLAQSPDSIQIITRIANHHYDLNQPDSAIQYYEKALFITPDSPDLLTDCAVMYFRLGNSEKALSYLDRAIQIKPDLAQAWFNKGFILMAGLNQPSEAMAAWRKFIEIDPESEQAKFIKAQIEAIEANESN